MGFTRQLIIYPSQEIPNMSQSEMQKLAFFGCTGSTGTAVLRNILSQQGSSVKLCLFVRSARKLKTLFPDIDNYPHLEIIEGQLADHATMMHCLSGATHIMCTVGSNENQPGMRMHRDAVDAILAALCDLKEEEAGAWKKPHMTFLSSASISETFIKLRPPFIHWLLMNALNHIYFDLAAAEKTLVSSPLVSVTLVHAPFLFEGEYSGYTITTDQEPAGASYADLGAAMAEMAFAPAGTEVKAVSVASHKSMGSLAMSTEQIRRLIGGFLGRFVPGYWG